MMKQIVTKITLFAAFLIFGCTNLNAQGVNWETAPLDKVIAKAKKTDKLVFIDCFTSWCAPCKWMTANVFPTKEAGDYFNKYFVCAKYDVERDENGKAVRSKYGVNVFPTFLILDCTGKEIGRVLGKHELTEFIEIIEIVKDKNFSPKALEDKVKETGDIKYLYEYIALMQKIDGHDFTGKAFNEHWNEINEYGKNNRANVIYFSRAIQLRTPTVLYYILDNKSAYDNRFGKAVMDNILVSGITEELGYYFSAPTMYNTNTIKQEDFERAYTVLSIIASDNLYSQILAKAVRTKYTGDNTELLQMLNAANLSNSLTVRELTHLNMLVNNMDIPQEVKENFTQKLKTVFTNTLNSLERRQR